MTASFPLEVIDLWNLVHSYFVFNSQKSRDDVNNALVFPSATIYITHTYIFSTKMCRMYSSQVSRFAFSDKIRNEVGIIAIQRLFWEGGITARQEPLNQTMVVGPLVGPFKTLLSILKGFNGIYIFYNSRYKITFKF